MLPRLHGTRKSLEPVLCALAQFCFDLSGPGAGRGVAFSRLNPLEPPAGQPELPVAFGKLQRIYRSLVANQFVSFTG